MSFSGCVKAQGIVQKNSIEYLEAAFQALVSKQVFIPIKSKGFTESANYINFESVTSPSYKTGWYAPKYELCIDDTTAQISFTSGTEGEPKGIILTHKNLHDTVTRLIDIMEITSDIKEYVGVPVYHSFGYGRVRVCNEVGGKAFIPESGFNPTEISELLANDEINAISAVPTLWRILLQQKHLFSDSGEKVRWIEIGSQFMTEDEKSALCHLFPNARIVQHYGLTEASRSTFLIISDRNKLNTVGKPFGDTEVRVNKTGRIEVRGAHVAKQQVTSSGYANITNEDGWFTTGDLGQLEQGYLTFLSRADDVVNIGGLKISPEDIERKVFELLDITRGLAITKIDDPIRGETILLNVLTEYSSKLEAMQEAVQKVLSDVNINLGGKIAFQELSDFPITDTGKIKRKLLSEKYLDLTAKNTTTNVDHDAHLIDRLKSNLNISDISEKDSFLSLNGDSLLLMMMSIEIEKHIGYIPENWEAMSFNDLHHFTTPVEGSVDRQVYPYTWLLILVVCGLVVGELFLQARSYIKTGRSAFNLINGESTVVYNKELDLKTYRPNLKLKDYKTGTIKYDINELGLRSPTINASPVKDELRIAVVGASSVAGAYADTNQKTFPALLEKSLRENNSNSINVINGGVEGVTLQGISSITEKIILPLQPNYVGVYTGFNDITTICKQEKSSSAPKLQPLMQPVQMPRWLMTSDMIKKNTVALRESPQNNNTYINVNGINIDWYKSAIDDIVTKIKSGGATPILITNARSYVNVEREKARELATSSLYYYYCLDLDGIIGIGERLNDSIRKAASEHNIPLIDLAKSMPGGSQYFVDGGHFTFRGEKYVAQQLSDFFKLNRQVKHVAN